jgi:wyosine [tRNA(Phe)-imidazoG37] synthetase (radical SAM superfamily)
MKEQLIQYAISAIIGSIAAYIVATIRTSAPAIGAKIESIPEWIEAKLNIDIPDRAQAVLHTIIHNGVVYASKLAMDERVWREVCRAVVARDPSKAVRLQEEMAKLDLSAGIEAIKAAMSQELKAAYNEASETVATQIIKANVATALPARIQPAEPEIRAAVRAVAPAVKPVGNEPVTQDTLARLLRESQERQARLAQ